MKIPRAFIFDLDGVIVETAHLHYKAWKRLADMLEIPFGKTENQMLKGLSRRKSLEKILSLDERELSEKKIQELMTRKNKWYQEDMADLTPEDMMEGIPEFLEQLRSMNVKLGIGSSSKNAQSILDYLQLNDFFETVIDGTKIDNSKPHPEVFLKAAKALNVDPEACLVFEDAASGIKAAKAGGMICVGVGSEEYLSEADLVISSFKGLTPKKLLLQLNT
jgi:beta-phosphoglucomutase